jgi:hypothetical protein
MIDRTHTGVRCHTCSLIRTVKGDLPRHSSGTVLYAMENLGRLLILVDWDKGFVVPVFPAEITLQLEDPAPAHSPQEGWPATAPIKRGDAIKLEGRSLESQDLMR